MAKKLTKDFFKKDAKALAKRLLGKIIVRKINGKTFRMRIVETEAYFDEKDPASWARFGKRKDNSVMWAEPGKILIKNVHKYQMFNIVSGRKDKAEAVLIRALEPLSFNVRLSGPGLLTDFLKINKDFHGKEIFNIKNLWMEDSNEKIEIIERFRVGIKEDLHEKLRFYIRDNKYISKK